MSVFQIVAISVLGLGVLISIGFTIAFVVESCTKKKEKPVKVEKVEEDEVSEIDLDAMLARLEIASQKETLKEEPVVEEPVQEEIKQEVKEEIPEEVVEETIEPVIEETIESVIEETETPVIEEQVEPVEEVVIEEVTVNEVKAEEPVAAQVAPEKQGPEFDYRIRLEKIKESQAKIDRDLEKTTRAILKYERTIRRKERNQKMLDRRALELTNLNLLMYSVTDIKNVDAEKKTRQEELTKHISELKASIQDADNYLEANKEKNENNIRLSEYLTHEKTRYADEVKELENAIASGKYFDDNSDGNN